MLAAHPHLSCGPETHFFRWLASVDHAALTKRAEWPEAAVNFVCSINRASYKSPERQRLIDHYRLTREQIGDFLQQSNPSIAAILACITEQYMQAEQKQRWVEKTPDHLEYLTDIRKHFPDAQIIRILRDPRDVAQSLSKVPWGVSSLLEGLLFWQRQEDLSSGFFEADHNSHTVKFENLIQNPETELRKICSFLDEPFESRMLDTSQTGKRLNSREVAWKSKSSQPIDHSRIEVWRRELAPADNQLAEALLGDRLMKYQYAREATFNRFGEVYPSLGLSIKYPEDLKMLASKGIRFWKTDPGETTTVFIYLGEPEYDRWFNAKPSIKYRDTMLMSAQILKSVLNRTQEIYWVPDKHQADWTGFSAYILKKLLAQHKFAT
jgi:hypothetical protein